jgi:hypothetical protein
MTKKKDYGELDTSLLGVMTSMPHRAEALLANDVVRRAAMRVARRRAGASQAESTDATIMERLNVLRLAGQISFDHSTGRWNRVVATAL